MPTIQFRLNAEQEAQAYEALQQTGEGNLNLLGKKLFLDFLDGKKNSADQLAALNEKIEVLVLQQEQILQGQDATDLSALMTTMGAIFMLTYGAVPITVRRELDNVFNSQAVIAYMKEAGE